MAKQPVRVLYVDDDAGLMRLVQRSLAGRGYTVEGAATGEQALARVAEGGIDVVALDHFLPTGTGLDVLARLRSVPAAPPVVYVTGSAETSIAVAALKAGAADYVPKAVDEEFLELLGSAIDQAMAKAELEREHARAAREVREAKDRAEVLLHEVNHRVANSLALVAALVRLQASSLADPAAKQALNDVQARITAIAGVHQRLYTADDVRSVEISGYLRGLLGELEATMRNTGHSANVRLNAEPTNVPTDKAVSIGVVVTELVTNAFKYAYPAVNGGEIRVALHKTAPSKINLSVADDGVGWRGEGPAKGTGIGSRIVSAMARGLGSTVTYAGGQGCRVSLEFEL